MHGTLETEPNDYQFLFEAETDAEQLQNGDNEWRYEASEENGKIHIKILDENGEFVGWW